MTPMLRPHKCLQRTPHLHPLRTHRLFSRCEWRTASLSASLATRCVASAGGLGVQCRAEYQHTSSRADLANPPSPIRRTPSLDFCSRVSGSATATVPTFLLLTRVRGCRRTGGEGRVEFGVCVCVLCTGCAVLVWVRVVTLATRVAWQYCARHSPTSTDPATDPATCRDDAGSSGVRFQEICRIRSRGPDPDQPAGCGHDPVRRGLACRASMTRASAACAPSVPPSPASAPRGRPVVSAHRATIPMVLEIPSKVRRGAASGEPRFNACGAVRQSLPRLQLGCRHRVAGAVLFQAQWRGHLHPTPRLSQWRAATLLRA